MNVSSPPPRASLTRERLALAAMAILTLLEPLRAAQTRSVPPLPVITLPDVEPLRFIVAGDTGMSSSIRSGMLEVHRLAPVHGIILVGDNFYECGVTSVDDKVWERVLTNFSVVGVPIYPVLGNHDYGNPDIDRDGKVLRECPDSDPGAQVSVTGTLAEWHFPARNYLLRGPFLEIVMFDTLPLANKLLQSYRGSETSVESRASLTKALGNLSAPWKVLAGHDAVVSSGIHGVSKHRAQRGLRELIPIFQKFKVDAYLAGHDHHLELLGDLSRKDRNPLYLISGAGSGRRPMEERDPGELPKRLFPAADAVPAETQWLGFAVLEVWRNCLNITFHDSTGRSRSDTFTVRQRNTSKAVQR